MVYINYIILCYYYRLLMGNTDHTQLEMHDEIFHFEMKYLKISRNF